MGEDGIRVSFYVARNTHKNYESSEYLIILFDSIGFGSF